MRKNCGVWFVIKIEPDLCKRIQAFGVIFATNGIKVIGSTRTCSKVGWKGKKPIVVEPF